MTITAKMIADSISPDGIRLTTMQLRYPKFIHGEFLTHRVFSRNSSSSRAIPVERLIKDVIEDPVVPSFWGKNQKGMQADEECDARVWSMDTGDLSDFEIDDWGLGSNGQYYENRREQAWRAAAILAIDAANFFAKAGYHKQIVNRLLEPFCHINTLVTSTEWSNFFALRCHPDAQPEMRLLAEAMRDAMGASVPEQLSHDPEIPFNWHMPYVNVNEWRHWPQDLVEGGDGYSAEECRDNLIKLSVARCARVSYLTQEGRQPSISEDLRLYDRLLAAKPLHASPAEHQATPDKPTPRWVGQGPYAHKMPYADRVWNWDKPELHGNLRGWVQYRKTLPGECQ